jgi:predicted HTH transcriptional regulator
MERIGSGIRFMLDETKRMGLPASQFRETSEFVVTFQQSPALSARVLATWHICTGKATARGRERVTFWKLFEMLCP